MIILNVFVVINVGEIFVWCVIRTMLNKATNRYPEYRLITFDRESYCICIDGTSDVWFLFYFLSFDVLLIRPTIEANIKRGKSNSSYVMMIRLSVLKLFQDIRYMNELTINPSQHLSVLTLYQFQLQLTTSIAFLKKKKSFK